MDNLTGADNIRKKMEENMASGKLAEKKTMSVPEMRELLGIKRQRATGWYTEIFSRQRSSTDR